MRTGVSPAWLVPLLFLFALAFLILRAGENGVLRSRPLRETVYPTLRSWEGRFLDLKFRARGIKAPRTPVVIVEIDGDSIDALGRWPWHRDVLAFLTDRIFESGAKAVGFDFVLSEPDPRIPDGLWKTLKQKNLESLASQVETDPVLAHSISVHRDHVVLGWTADGICQSSYESPEICPGEGPARWRSTFDSFAPFAIPETRPAGAAPLSPLPNITEPVPNAGIFANTALHQGLFNSLPDPDGVIRRAPLVFRGGGFLLPSLPLELARVAKGEDLEAESDRNGALVSLRWKNGNLMIPVSPLGMISMDFRGPAYSFPYVSVLEVLSDRSELRTGFDRVKLMKRSDLFRDAVVLVGVTAVGLYDLRAFPYDPNVPGVEGHATVLDQLLSDAYLKPLDASTWGFLPLFLLTFVAGFLGFLFLRLDAVPALLVFGGSAIAFAVADFTAFSRGFTLETGLFYTELATLLLGTLALKYVSEERNRKFVRGAFAKYVAPSVVDHILKHPERLVVGGERKELAILFSDIRGFTSFSEKLDPRTLSQFLGEYLTAMTELVFQEKGTLDKYIGDAVMAFWGAPLEPTEPPARSALRAAVAMQRKAREIAPGFKARFGIDLEIGIGFNQGPVSVGNMGSTRIFSYTVIGDSVNLASRLEGLTKTYGAPILTERSTLVAAGEAGFPSRTLDRVRVKGKDHAIELVEILDSASPPSTWLRRFVDARNLYESRKFQEAEAAFQAASEARFADSAHTDPVSLLFVERCRAFRDHPPPSDWDGAWDMDTK